MLFLAVKYIIISGRASPSSLFFFINIALSVCGSLFLDTPLPLCHFIFLMWQNPSPRWPSHTCAAQGCWTKPDIRSIISYINWLLASSLPCHFPTLNNNDFKSSQTFYCTTLPPTLQETNKQTKPKIIRHKVPHFPICIHLDVLHSFCNTGAILFLHLCFGLIPSSWL